MLKLRLKNSSQSFEFLTLNFGLKGELISIYDPELSKSIKFVTKNIFDIKVLRTDIKNDENLNGVLKKKIKVEIKLKNTSDLIAIENVIQTNSNEKFFIIHSVVNEKTIEERYFPLSDIEYISEDY